MSYRKAFAIEMHDSMSCINVKDHFRLYYNHVGQREWGKTAYISNLTLEELAGMFDLVFQRGETRWDKKTQKGCSHYYGDLTLVIPYDEGDGEEVNTLECDVISAQMVNVRTTSSYEEDGIEHQYVEEFTYCGSFTIWWDVMELNQNLDNN